tara:strand:- start:96 stop:734 length:639 start_codon:yes stop_codon:yes gene_type:complete
MARRKDHTPEELKAWVIRSVLEFLQRQPAQELSLRKVAKRVDYSPGTLINLFGSYAHLLLAVNAATLDQISGRLNKNLAASNELDAEQQLLLFAQEYLAFARQHTFQWRLLFEHRLDEDVPDWQQNRINQLFELIEVRLIQLCPHAKPAELLQASRTIWASVHGICMLEVDNKIFAADSSNGLSINGESMIQSLISHYLSSWKVSSNTNTTC